MPDIPCRKLALRALLASLALSLALGATTARALTFTYEWAGTTSSGGTVGAGFITFDAAVADPANFAGLTLADVDDLSYTWNNGVTSVSVSEAEMTTLIGSISAVGGVLSNFTLAGNPGGATASFNVAPAPALGANNFSGFLPGGTGFVDQDAGNWRLAAVPEPGTWALIVAGFLGLAAIGRRRRA
jgi:hypothetical protein